MNWQHALDLQMDQVAWLRTEYGKKLTMGFFSVFFEKLEGIGDDVFAPLISRVEDAQMWMNVQETLWRGDTIFVTTDMQHLLLQAAHDLPKDATFDVHSVICPMGFCLFEETIYGRDVNDKTIAVNALAWHVSPIVGRDEQAIGIYFLTSSDDMEDDANRTVIPKMRAEGMPIPPFGISHFYPATDGDTIPDFENVPGSELVRAMLKLFLAMNFLAQQKIGEPMKMRAPRATRRRYNFSQDERMITLITLRRKSVKHEGEPQKVDWQHRWVVRGHWRRQWYPKTKRNDWVYIYEHIKGPEDKPLVVTERRVFNFRR